MTDDKQKQPCGSVTCSAELGEKLGFGETYIEWNHKLTNIKNLPEYEYEMFLERMRAFRVAHYVIKKQNEVMP